MRAVYGRRWRPANSRIRTQCRQRAIELRRSEAALPRATHLARVQLATPNSACRRQSTMHAGQHGCSVAPCVRGGSTVLVVKPLGRSLGEWRLLLNRFLSQASEMIAADTVTSEASSDATPATPAGATPTTAARADAAGQAPTLPVFVVPTLRWRQERTGERVSGGVLDKPGLAVGFFASVAQEAIA